MTERAVDEAVGELCALLARPRGSGRASDEVIACARHHRMHLVLADQLALPALMGELRAAAALEAARDAELGRVLAACAAVGARPILIKGASIAQTDYRRPELRPRIDTDLFIPAGGRLEITRALESLGYQRPVETDGELCVSQFHVERIDSAGIHHALDVHWRISNALAFAEVLSYDEVAADAVPLPGLGPSAFGPSAVHSALIACVHRVAHHGDSPHLLWLNDIRLLAGRLDTRERAIFAEIAVRRRVRAVCARSLRRADEAFGGVPRDMLDALEKAPAPVEPTAAFLGDRRRLVDVLKADLLALDGWSRRVQLVREHVFPAREYMYARYGRRPLSLPWLYMYRIVSGAPKWFRQ